MAVCPSQKHTGKKRLDLETVENSFVAPKQLNLDRNAILGRHLHVDKKHWNVDRHKL